MKKPIIHSITLLLAALTTTATATLINAPADADTHVRLGTADQNYGATRDLPIKNSGANGTTRHGYIRFDVSGLLNQTIQDATLSLDMVLNNGGGNPVNTNAFDYTVTVFGLNDGHAGENWIEGNNGTDNNPVGEITWNNAPGNDTAGNAVLAGQTTNLGSFITPVVNPALNNTAEPVTFSSQALADFITADTDGFATLILVRTSSNGNNLGFASKETTFAGASGPMLMINTIPEPSSGLLFLFGALLLRRFRTRV